MCSSTLKLEKPQILSGLITEPAKTTNEIDRWTAVGIPPIRITISCSLSLAHSGSEGGGFFLAEKGSVRLHVPQYHRYLPASMGCQGK